MADVFLIKLEPDYESHTFAPPFGILYLASALEKEGFQVKLYHERGTPENIQALSSDVLKSHPLCVGISTFTGPSILPSLIFSKKIKENSKIPVVWGGLHATMLPGDRIASIITSRGCPWRCGYCYNQFVNKRSFRAHSVQRVVQDIENLERNHRATAVVFEGNCFFADKKRALDILRQITSPGVLRSEPTISLSGERSLSRNSPRTTVSNCASAPNRGLRESSIS